MWDDSLMFFQAVSFWVKLISPTIQIKTIKISNTIRAEFETSKLTKGYGFLTAESTFSQSRFSEFETTTDGYTILNAGVGGEFEWLKQDFKVSLSISNLTDKKYINHLSRLKADGIYNQGRSIMVGMHVKF